MALALIISDSTYIENFIVLWWLTGPSIPEGFLACHWPEPSFSARKFIRIVYHQESIRETISGKLSSETTYDRAASSNIRTNNVTKTN